MTIEEAKKYIQNWNNIADFFKESTLSEILQTTDIKGFSTKVNVPTDSDVNRYYENKGFYKESAYPKSHTITEYMHSKGVEWERRVTKSCYTWIVPDQYQLEEAQVIKKALLAEYPYLNEYPFSVYHFDRPVKVKGHDYGMEIYVDISTEHFNKVLYVPLLALKQKSPDMIIARHSGYFHEYHNTPDRKKFLDEALSVLKMEKTKSFFTAVKGEKKKIKLPVTWKVCGIVEIEATNIEEAIRIFDSNVDNISLPNESEYVDASFDLSDRDENYIKLFQE